MRIMRAVEGLQLLILLLLLHFHFNSLHMSQFCACDLRGTLLLHCLTQRTKDRDGCVNHVYNNIATLLQCS